MGAVFLSYRRDDSQFATDRIYEHLTRHFDRKSIFKDVDNVPYGTNFKTHIAGAVKDSRVMLAVIGPNWLDIRNSEGKRRIDEAGDYVRIELETALQSGVKIIPILVGGAKMPSTGDLPESLRSLSDINAVQVRADPDFRQDVQRLVGAVQSLSVPPGGAMRGRLLVGSILAVLALAGAGLWLALPASKPTGTVAPVVQPVPGKGAAGKDCEEYTFTDNSKGYPVTSKRLSCK